MLGLDFFFLVGVSVFRLFLVFFYVVRLHVSLFFFIYNMCLFFIYSFHVFTCLRLFLQLCVFRRVLGIVCEWMSRSPGRLI